MSATRHLELMLDAGLYEACEELAAREGIQPNDVIRRAFADAIERKERAERPARPTLLDAGVPLHWRQILVNEEGEAFLIRRIYKRTVWAQKWDVNDGPAQRFTFTHAQAKAMRRFAPVLHVYPGDILVWGDKAGRVTTLPLPSPSTKPQMIGLSVDWDGDGEVYEDVFPLTPADFWCRCIRLALPAEVEAFERAEDVREGLRFPSLEERRNQAA